MTDISNSHPIYYYKLVRDKIPSIIREKGHQPAVSSLSGQEWTRAASQKLLEEAYELFTAITNGDKESVLKESSDVLEITLTILKQQNYSFDDLLAELEKRREQRGGFEQGLFLESVDGQFLGARLKQSPGFVCTHLDTNSLLELFRGELERSDKAWIASAFYSPAITNILTSEFERFICKGGEARVILSTMNGFIKPEYLVHLRDYVPELKVKVFHPSEIPFDKHPQRDFHVKAYIFKHRTGKGSAIIGSSNLSQGGFSDNIEWNYYTPGEINLPFYENQTPWEKIVQEFDSLWENQCVHITDDFLDGYRERHRDVFQEREKPPDTYGYEGQSSTQWSVLADSSAVYGTSKQSIIEPESIQPNVAQSEALEGLKKLRTRKARSGAVIAATGVGKTYLAAFDFIQSGKDKCLFIAHREDILRKARESFSHVLGPEGLEIFSGRSKDVSYGSKAVFAMIQTLGRQGNMKRFHPREFDYIVMDEFHHAMANTYRKVLDYFQPDFLLGLTATPERMDGRDVLWLCDYNIAYEMRLFQAIDKELLAPFQYFAVHDPTDYAQIAWKRTDYDQEELTMALANDTRNALIANNLKKFLPYQGKIKALAFCSSVDHAHYTANRLTQEHGLEATALVGDSSQEQREKVIARLEKENDPLKVICCVDIFNEGVDIPRLSHVLLLRPTQSFTVFLQQLGRGLRKVQTNDVNKHLVVIDFVGNYRSAHVAPLALAGYTSFEEYIRDSARTRGSKSGMSNPPLGCFVSPDLEVQRIWDSKLREIVPMPRGEQLRDLYDEVVQDLGLISPGLCEFYADPQRADPHAFIKHFGSWIKTKKYFDDLSNTENSLLSTQGESFLEYLEKDLNPVKSYKMVVLKTLLSLKGTSWKIDDIASGFLNYYLQHPEHIYDYDELDKQDNPANLSLQLVKRHITKMPLYYLSNKSNDWFILDREQDKFSLKADLVDYWNNKNYKMLVLDRVKYALARYFYRKTK